MEEQQKKPFDLIEIKKFFHCLCFVWIDMMIYRKEKEGNRRICKNI